MARYTYLALTLAVPGREADFDDWYDGRHLDDVARMPGVVAAQRFTVEWQKSTEFAAPQWRSLAIYEIESDDPVATIETIRLASGTELMPMSDAMHRPGMVQILANAVKSAD